MRRSSFTRLIAAATLLGGSIAGGGISQAQYDNRGTPSLNGPGLGNGSPRIEGSYAAEQNWVSSSRGGPVWPGKSPMPLTTLEVMPLTGMDGAVSDAGDAGVSGGLLDSQAVGTRVEQWPYTTARVAVTGTPGPSTGFAVQVPVTSRPYRFAGKLWMRFGTDWFVCTASLIKRGVLITAAHCVHNYGQQNAGFADEVRWFPANYSTGGSGGPWGYYLARQWRIPGYYWLGNDTCQAGANGVVCNNDIATVVLWPKGGVHAGDALGGWYNYGWNAYGLVNSPAFGNGLIGLITQLGYPSAIDSGAQMLRNDSFGKFISGTGANGKQLKNLQLGSAMTGGSSGGPWLVNFGTRPTITGAASLGSQSASNFVMAVTSWGYVGTGLNVQGASWFGQNAEYPLADYGGRGAGNIGFIVNVTCSAWPAYC